MSIQINHKVEFLNNGRKVPEIWKVVGFEKWDNGERGIVAVRFIKSRNAWAKTPISWFSEEKVQSSKMFKLV